MYVGIALALAGCSSAHGPKATSTVQQLMADDVGTKQEIRKINEKLFSSVTAAPSLQDYVLG